ncbi:plasmid mobilization protein [Helicobacter pylori]|uniref:plasmid mobilization protein n=1 Tax=Helicobacter pylori TaxID=210 RepID=UPI0034660273
MKKQVDTNKQIIKSLRLSQKQWQTIQTQMQEKNLNFSQLVLNSLLIQNSQTPTKSKKQKAIANKELVIELAKWGNNLNQIAKCLNTNKGAWDRLGLE